jgi:hypothetical protein
MLQWQVTTFGAAISNTGGYASLLNLLVNFMMYYYQCFMYESSIMKRVYREKKVDRDHGDT